jgi:hypothetical protein
MVAFKDRRPNKWKVLDTGTDEDADVDRQVAYFGQRHLGGTDPGGTCIEGFRCTTGRTDRH